MSNCKFSLYSKGKEVKFLFPGLSLFTRKRIKQITDKPLQQQSVLCSHVVFFFLKFLQQQLHILIALQQCMFTVSALALETGGAANETPSFLIVFLVKPWLINAAKFPVCEQSTSDLRRADDSQWSAAPSHRAERTFGSRWSRSASENWLLECFCSSLRPSVPTDAGTDRRRVLFLLAKNHEGDRKEWGWDEGIKILDEEPGVLPAQSAHLLSQSRLEQPGTPRYTHRQAATPGTTAHVGVPSQPACSQTFFCGDMRNSVSPPPLFALFIFNWSWWLLKRAVVKENWPSTYKYPASLLHLKAESLTMQKACCRGRARLLPVACVGEAYILSLAYMSFSHVFVLGTTAPTHPLTPNPSGRLKGRYRHVHWQFVSARTGCGGGGSGFGLNDLSQSHLFYGLWEAVSTSGEDLCRTVSGALPKFKSVSYSDMR